MQVKRKHGRPPKAKLENQNSNTKCTTAATTHTTQPCKTIKIPSNDIAFRELVSKINVECKKSDRLTVAKLNTASKLYKRYYKSKLMTEKYSLLAINPQQLTPAQTALQRMSEKHPDFEIQAVNTIRPPDIEYTKTSQPLVPVDYRSLENTFPDNLTLINCKKYRNTSDTPLPSGSKAQNCIHAEALNYVVVNNFLFRIDTQKDKDRDKGNLFLLVIPEKYELIILHTCHESLLAGHQGPYRTAMTIRQKFFIHNLMNKVKRYVEACHMCLKTKPKSKYLEIIKDDLEDTAPEYEPVFTSVYQYYGNSLASFTNTIDDLLLQLPILIKLKVQVPMLLFSIETVPVPLDAET